MRTLALLLATLVLTACSPDAVEEEQGACDEPTCAASCPEVRPSACSPGNLLTDTDDEGCTVYRCEPCEDPGLPAPDLCPRGTVEEVVDQATGCTVGWGCTPCAELPPPADDFCPEGTVRASVDPDTGCDERWVCLDHPADPDRWADLDGLRDGALIDALYGRISGQTALSYEGARDEIFNRIGLANGKVECIYTGRQTAPDGTRTPGDMNAEHSWPQSEGADALPAKSDMHHLFPADATANSRRSSYPFGDTACSGSACTWANGGSELGAPAGGAGTVFEVRPQSRGDIARAHFYFSVRYRLHIGAAEEANLRTWDQQDPPDARERSRNDEIERIQHNRNPFVDRPDLAGRIADF